MLLVRFWSPEFVGYASSLSNPAMTSWKLIPFGSKRLVESGHDKLEAYPTFKQTTLVKSRTHEQGHPIMTVGKPTAIDPPCAVMSPILAAGMNPIMTVKDPSAIASGGPTQTHMSPTRAAGMNPIITIGKPNETGPPTCGIGGVPGVTIGQTCMSPIRAAGGMGIPC